MDFGPLVDGAMVTSPDGKGVILSGGYIGGDDDSGYRKELMELRCSKDNDLSSCKWSELPHKMTQLRGNHVAFYVPEDLAKCN